MNTVEINADALTQEAQVIAANEPPDELAQPSEQAQPAGAPVQDSWVPFAHGVIPTLSMVLLPQWQLTKDEQRELGESLGLCLDQVFPGGMQDRYMCWVRLMFCAGGIVTSRAMAHGGKLPPVGPRKAPKQTDKKDDSAPDPTAS